MTEDEARALLRRGDREGLEAWIAAQPWRPTLNGWEADSDLAGWRFSLRILPDGVWITSTPPGKALATGWLVAAR